MPAEFDIAPYPPGQLIREELEARGWSQQDLAQVMGRNHALVSEIVNAKRSITPETAQALADAFGTSPGLWLNLETTYRLTQRQQNAGRPVSLRARLYEKAPVRPMIRRGWISDVSDPALLTMELLRFFERTSLDEAFEFGHAARKSDSDKPTTPAQWAWLHRARQMARTLRLHVSWRISRVREFVHALRALAFNAEAVRDIPRVMEEFGIRFVVVEPLPQAKMDGASFWLDDDEAAPVIAVSVRYDRIDNFWHTVMHEVGHVVRKDGLSMDVEILTDREGKSEAEQRADEFAVNSLVPQDELADFCLRAGPLYSAAKIIGFATRLRIHPGIVVGQLHHRGKMKMPGGIDFSYFRKMLTPVRRIIASAAFTDGWGKAVPLT